MRITWFTEIKVGGEFVCEELCNIPPRPPLAPYTQSSITHTHLYCMSKLLQGLCYTGKKIPPRDPEHLLFILRLRNK